MVFTVNLILLYANSFKGSAVTGTEARATKRGQFRNTSTVLAIYC